MEWKRGPCQTYTTEPVSCYPATFQLNPLPPFFWRQVKVHTELHVLWHRDERLMWMERIRISKGQTSICATASCNELEASNRQMRFEKWWLFIDLLRLAVSESFKSSVSQNLDERNAWIHWKMHSILRSRIRVETLPIYFQQYSDLRAVSFLCQWKLTTTQIPISVAFDFSAGRRKNTSNKWTTKQVVEIGDFNFLWYQWVKLY